MYAESAAELRARDMSIIPAPREITFTGETYTVSRDPEITTRETPDGTCAAAIDMIRNGFAEALPPGDRSAADIPRVSLSVEPGCIDTETDDGQNDQAYRVDVTGGHIAVVANAPVGLIHAAASLIQLIDTAPGGRVPGCTIVDWPIHALRFVHWDTKHHQDRIETLHHHVEWIARLKLNAVSFELEDKLAYRSHPVVGAPGAYTIELMAALTRHALARGIQIVPNIQAPAHMCYALKHQEYAHLRCDGSNYMACMDDPDVRRFIFDLYQDACDATPGIPWFHVSTDEVYYAGICEGYRSPYSPGNRSLTLVEFLKAAHAFLAERGRRIITWVEFPILPEHIELLPTDIVDGIVGNDGFPERENARGIRQLVYVPIQGEELLFPRYYPYTDRNGDPQRGRLADVDAAPMESRASRGKPIGTFVAGWDDAGLHNEAFWPGIAAMAQVGWTGESLDAHTSAAEFTRTYCGNAGRHLVDVYTDLQAAAQFFEQTWDREPSRVRPAAYGASDGKRPVTRTDLTMHRPSVPDAETFNREESFRERYAALLSHLDGQRTRIERLTALLDTLGHDVTRNAHHVDVLASIGRLIAQHIHMLTSLTRADELIDASCDAYRRGERGAAAASLREAAGLVNDIEFERAAAMEHIALVWQRSHHERNRTVGGRAFVHVMDDVKDHFADRRIDLSYMTAPQESMELVALAGELDRLADACIRD